MSHTAQSIRHALSTWLEPADFVDAADSGPYLRDQRGRYCGQAQVVRPDTVAKIQAVVRFCRAHDIPITPQGGNTGLCGGAVPNGGILLNLGRLNRIRNISLADNAITVEAGVVLHDVQQAAEQLNRLFPLSLASEGTCQIGGNLATNAGGLNVVRYGTARDLVLGLEVVLPDGSLVSHLAPLYKNTTAYELKHLFIGSEGTLGIITAATLRLFAPIRSRATAWIGVTNIHQSVDLLIKIQSQFATRLSSFELLSADALTLSAQFSQLPAPTQAAWHVLLELSDSVPSHDLNGQLAEFLYEIGFENSILCQSDSQRADLWRLRENVSAAQKGLGVSIKHDIAVPISQVAEMVAAATEAIHLQFAGAKCVVFGHLGDGSLHFNVFLPTTDASAYRQEEAVNRVIYQYVLAHSGTIAAEHGIGYLKTAWLPQVRTESELQLMHAIKSTLDPKHLFNPNKVLPPI